MSESVNKVNEIFDHCKEDCSGSFHNFLWQILVNDSMQGSEAALVRMPGHDGLTIAIGNGGYVPASFDCSSDETIEHINREIFGLTPEGAQMVVCRSMFG